MDRYEWYMGRTWIDMRELDRYEVYGTDISGMGWLYGVWDRYDGHESIGQRCMSDMRICDGYEWYGRDMSGMGEI